MSSKIFYLFVILILLFLNSPSLHGQNYAVIDSLQKTNIAETDAENRVNNLLTIADEFTHHNTDSAFYYIDAALKLGQETSYKEGQAEAFFMQSYYYDLTGDYDKAIESLEKSTDLFIILGDSSYLSGCYNNLGVLYSYGNNQKKSLEYFIQSVYIGEELQDSFSLAEGYSNIAGFYEELEEYSSALKYFKKGLIVDQHFNFPEDVAISHLDVAYMYIKLLRYDEALENLKAARVLLKEISDPFYRTILFQRFAHYYSETQELDSAFLYILKAQKLSANFNAPMLHAETLSIKGNILLKQKKYNESVAVIDSAILSYKSLNAQSSITKLYKNKADAYFELGLLNRAYQFLQLGKLKDDSLKSYENAEVLSEFEKIETQKEERKRIQLQQELENQRNENSLITVKSKLYFTILLAIFLGIVLVVSLYFFILKQKHNKSLEKNYELINYQKDLLEKSYSNLKENESRLTKLNATKDKFFSIIAHDLKNPFSTLIGISELMISEPDIKHTEDFEELLQGMFQTAQSGHNLLVNLLEWSRSQIGNISVERKRIELNDVCNSTISFFQETAKAKDININVSNLSAQQVYADYNMVNFICRNLVNNAIKFSHKSGEIDITAEVKNQTIIVHIQDYGIGMNDKTTNKLFKIEHSIQRDGTASEKGTGLGLILCKEFIEQSNGEIWVKSEEGKGSTFSFSLPKFESKE